MVIAIFNDVKMKIRVFCFRKELRHLIARAKKIAIILPDSTPDTDIL